jgi:hypothetical protein
MQDLSSRRQTPRQRLPMLVLAAAVAMTSAMGANGEQSLETHLAELNRQTFEDYALRHDVELYSQATLPEYLLVVNIGIVETRDEVLATASNLAVDALHVEHDHFARNGDTAVVSGLLHLEGTILGQPLPPRVR